MIDVQSLYESKLSMARSLLESKRAQAFSSARGFSTVYASAVKTGTPEFIRYRAPEPEEVQQEEPATAASDINAARAYAPTIGGSSEYDGLIQSMSAKYGVDSNLIKSVMKSESNFRPNAVSSAGAMGLMQLMPGTAGDMGVTDPYDPVQNIEGGVKYLGMMLKRFDGDVALALAAYNCGPRKVENLGVQSSANTEQFSRLAGNVQRYATRVMERAGYTLGEKISI